MKWLALCFLAVFFNGLRASGNQDSLAALEGRWYVNLSNFKMWLKGDKHNPTFTYGVAVKKGSRGLKDVVSYEKKGRPRQIVGFDQVVDSAASSFVWRGKGLLALFKSKWQIVYRSGDVMLIRFEKTLATAEGYDVISRHKQLSAEEMAALLPRLEELGIRNLQIIPQQ